MDYFIGLLFGEMPYFSKEIYQSDISDLKA
jgi:hypothetical protein